MCAHTPLGVHRLCTAPSLDVVPAAAQLWWRKLSLNVPSAHHENSMPCVEACFGIAEMAVKTVHFKEFICTRCQSEWLFYSMQKLKSLLFPNLWMWSCGYVNTHDFKTLKLQYQVSEMCVQAPSVILVLRQQLLLEFNLSLLIPQTNGKCSWGPFKSKRDQV